MGTHRYEEPGEETDGSDEHRPIPALADPGRVHVTLDNLVDLANFNGSALTGFAPTHGGAPGPGRVDLPPPPAIPGAPTPIPAFPVTPPMPPTPVEPPVGRRSGSMPAVPVPDGPDDDYRPDDGYRADDDHGPDAYAPPGVAPGPGAAPGLGAGPEAYAGDHGPDAGSRPGPGAGPGRALAPPDAPAAPDAPAPASTPEARRTNPVPGFYAGSGTTDTGSHQAFYAGSSDPDDTGYREFWGSADDHAAVTASSDAHPAAAGTDTAAVARSGWARPAERWLLEVLAITAASMALVLPSLTFVAVLVAVVVGATMAFLRSGRPGGALPGRILARSVRLLHPRSSLWLPVLLSRTVLAAVAIPGGISALLWLDEHGRNGAIAAARQGAWDSGFRVFALLLSAMLLTSVGDGRRQRAAAVRRWAAPATDGTLVILVLSCAAAVALMAIAVPHPVDPIADRADGLGWVPPGARARADAARDDIVTHELDTVAACLAPRTGTHWRPSYTSGNPVGEVDVARLSAGSGSTDVAAPPPHDLVTAVVATHNQLAPWVEVIEVEWQDRVLLSVDRTALSHREPLLDPQQLLAATTDGATWVERSPLDVTIALRCSAGNTL